MKLSNAIQTSKVLLPQLASLLWAHRQALLQERAAAGQERERWQVVIAVTEQRIRELEREITECLDVLKFKVKGRVF